MKTVEVQIPRTKRKHISKQLKLLEVRIIANIIVVENNCEYYYYYYFIIIIIIFLMLLEIENQ